MGTTAAAAATATESEDAPQARRHDCTCGRLASRSEPFKPEAARYRAVPFLSPSPHLATNRIERLAPFVRAGCPHGWLGQDTVADQELDVAGAAAPQVR